jgi:hypothetical protein
MTIPNHQPDRHVPESSSCARAHELRTAAARAIYCLRPELTKIINQRVADAIRNCKRCTAANRQTR